MSLKTDYKDAMFQGNRKYQMIQNEDGTVSFEDVTEYTQEGDPFGAKDINATNTAVELKFDSDDVVDPMVATEPGFAADAKATGDAIKSQNSKIETVESKADQAFQQASDGKTAIANAISGKGVAASASETFTSLASKITNNLYKPPTSQSGSTSCVCTLNGSTSNVLVKFPQGFETIPKVIVSASFSDMNYIKSYAATQISKTGFTATVTAAKASVSSAQNTKFTVAISWNASV